MILCAEYAPGGGFFFHRTALGPSVLPWTDTSDVGCLTRPVRMSSSSSKGWSGGSRALPQPCCDYPGYVAAPPQRPLSPVLDQLRFQHWTQFSFQGVRSRCPPLARKSRCRFWVSSSGLHRREQVSEGMRPTRDRGLRRPKASTCFSLSPQSSIHHSRIAMSPSGEPRTASLCLW